MICMMMNIYLRSKRRRKEEEFGECGCCAGSLAACSTIAGPLSWGALLCAAATFRHISLPEHGVWGKERRPGLGCSGTVGRCGWVDQLRRCCVCVPTLRSRGQQPLEPEQSYGQWCRCVLGFCLIVHSGSSLTELADHCSSQDEIWLVAFIGLLVKSIIRTARPSCHWVRGGAHPGRVATETKQRSVTPSVQTISSFQPSVCLQRVSLV